LISLEQGKPTRSLIGFLKSIQPAGTIEKSADWADSLPLRGIQSQSAVCRNHRAKRTSSINIFDLIEYLDTTRIIAIELPSKLLDNGSIPWDFSWIARMVDRSK